MENMFSLPLAIRPRNSGGISSQATQDSAVESNSFNFSYQNQVVDVVHGNPVMNQARIFETINFGGSSVGLGFQEQFMAGRGCPQENMDNLALSAAPNNPIDLRGYSYIDDSSGNIRNSFMIPSDDGFGAGLESMNSKWDFEKTGGFSSVGYMDDPSGWSGGNFGPEFPYTSSRTSNELSLSLATAVVPDQSSEVGTSGAGGTPSCCFNTNGLSSEQASSGCNQLSRGFNSQAPFRGSGSRYLHAVQEILAQVASFSLEHLDQTSYSAGARSRGNMSFHSHQIAEIQDPDDDFQPQIEPALQKRSAEAKNAQLLALLQAVDDRYNQCVDEIHTVVSAFHAATELDPQVHTRFALQTISALYRNLRETISKQIISTGAIIEKCCSSGKEGSSRNLFTKEQWAVKQLKNKQHQHLWKPQRGLPEKSVCVLRQWMFENFLHPYPKDAEKHILAVKSGLTRSQVTNWFINARVRLWKPLIEEMYKEMNRNKSGRRSVLITEKQQQQIYHTGDQGH